VPAGLTSPKSAAAPGHRAGCDREGPAVPAGFISPMGAAAPGHRTGCDHARGIHRFVREGGSRASRTHVSFERCHAMTACRICSRAGSPQGVREGAAVPAGLIPLTSVAAPGHRAGCDHARCSHHCVREGAAVLAGLIPLTSGAAPCHRAGGDHAQRCHQCVREGPAVPADLISPSSAAVQGHRAGRVHALRSQQCVREVSAVLTGPASLTRPF